MKIILLNKICEKRLKEVRDQMKILGAPSIQCFELSPGVFLATEGSHRLTAAKELKLIPILDIIDKFDEEDLDTKQYYIDAKRRMCKGLVIDFDEDDYE